MATTKRPNIILILADDWGYGDLGCQGNEEISTPCLDKFATESSRFTRFYVSSPVCSPSRVSFFTGQYPARWNVEGHFAGYGANKRRYMPNWLDLNAPSLPRLLKDSGYRTAHYGKWHLGGGGGIHGHPDAPFVKEYGYDDTRTWNGNGPTWHGANKWPHTLFNDSDNVWAANSSRIAVDATMEFIAAGDEEAEKAPYFINLWLKDPHCPLVPTEEQREPFKHLPEPQQTYYSVIHDADKHVGRLLDFLDERGEADNTIVMFTSDNGCEHRETKLGTYGSVGPLRGHKHILYDGGVRVPFLLRWPAGNVPVGEVNESLLGSVDLFPTLLKIAEVPLPVGYVADGINCQEQFTGKPRRRGRPLLWQWPFNGFKHELNWATHAIRNEDFGLLFNQLTGERALFKTADLPQENDCAAEFPEVVEDLYAQAQEWLQCLPRQNMALEPADPEVAPMFHQSSIMKP